MGDSNDEELGEECDGARQCEDEKKGEAGGEISGAVHAHPGG
jgi:hypothetical protein